MLEDSIDFMTNLAKIALDLREDILASIIVNQYYFRLNEGMIKFAIANQCYTFIEYNILFNWLGKCFRVIRITM